MLVLVQNVVQNVVQSVIQSAATDLGDASPCVA